MSFRGGRGGGRGRGGFGGGGFRPARQLPFELFPEIEDLGTAKVSVDNQLVKWSWQLQKDRESSPYYYEDRSKRHMKMQKVDIERYSDKKSLAKDDKRPLWHYIKLGSNYMPAELADDKKRHAKKVKWTSGSDMNKLEYLEKLEEKHGEQGTDKKEKKEDEEEEESGENEDDGEYSDEGDYEQNEYFDDDEDDFNMVDDNGSMLYRAYAFIFTASSPVMFFHAEFSVSSNLYLINWWYLQMSHVIDFTLSDSLPKFGACFGPLRPNFVVVETK